MTTLTRNAPLASRTARLALGLVLALALVAATALAWALARVRGA